MLERAMQVTTVRSASAAPIFFDNWIILYGTQTNLLIAKGTEFVSKLLTAVAVHMAIKQLKTTTCYTQLINKSTVLTQKSGNGSENTTPNTKTTGINKNKS